MPKIENGSCSRLSSTMISNECMVYHENTHSQLNLGQKYFKNSKWERHFCVLFFSFYWIDVSCHLWSIMQKYILLVNFEWVTRQQMNIYRGSPTYTKITNTISTTGGRRILWFLVPKGITELGNHEIRGLFLV